MPRTIRVIRFGPLGAGGVPPTLTDVARLSLPNVFARENTFSGIRLGDIKLVSSDYTVVPTDCVILADAADQDVVITLPSATGSGQLLRIRKIDLGLDHVVTVAPQSGELIDIYPSITLVDYSKGILIEDGLSEFWDLVVSPFGVDSNSPNVFTAINTFAGIRIAPPKFIIDDYALQATDFEVLVDCSVKDADIALQLPLSVGNGQMYHIKKIDDTNHVVSINRQGSDLIDGSISLNLAAARADAWLIAGAPDYWDNTGPANILIVPDDPPPTPTTNAEVVALLQSYGLCA